MADELRAYRKLKTMFPRAHFTRVETWTSTGVPDANACMDGKESWIECKDVIDPKRPTTLIKSHNVRPEQIAWEARRREAGGRTFVALMVGKCFYLLRGTALVELKNGLSRSRLSELSLDPSELFI